MEGDTDFVVAVVLPDLLQRPDNFADHCANLRSDEAAVFATTGLPVRIEHDLHENAVIGTTLKERNLAYQKEVLLGLESKRGQRARRAIYDVITGQLPSVSLGHAINGIQATTPTGIPMVKNPQEISIVARPGRPGSDIVHVFPSKSTLASLSDEELADFAARFQYPVPPNISSKKGYIEMLGRSITERYRKVTSAFSVSKPPHPIMSTEGTIIQASAESENAPAKVAETIAEPPAPEPVEAMQVEVPVEAEPIVEPPAGPSSPDDFRDLEKMGKMYQDLSRYNAKVEQERAEQLDKLRKAEERLAAMESKQKEAEAAAAAKAEAERRKNMEEAEKTLKSYLQLAEATAEADKVKNSEPMLRKMLETDPLQARNFFADQRAILVQASAAKKQADEAIAQQIKAQQAARDEQFFSTLFQDVQSARQQSLAARHEAAAYSSAPAPTYSSSAAPPPAAPTSLKRQMEEAIAATETTQRTTNAMPTMTPVMVQASSDKMCQVNFAELSKAYNRPATYDEVRTGPCEKVPTGVVTAGYNGGPAVEQFNMVPKRQKLGEFGMKEFAPTFFKKQMSAMRSMSGATNPLPRI